MICQPEFKNFELNKYCNIGRGNAVDDSFIYSTVCFILLHIIQLGGQLNFKKIDRKVFLRSYSGFMLTNHYC